MKQPALIGVLRTKLMSAFKKESAMNKIMLITVLILCVVIGGYAQNITKVGTTAGQFLKVDIGPRAIGMGGAFVATADDITGLYWNPAGIARNYSAEAVFNHVNWFADINLDYAAASVYINGLGSLGAFVNVLSMDDMTVRTVEMPEGTGEIFTYSGLALGLSYARELTDNFSIGFNVKYVRESIWNSTAQGFAIDVGTLYRIPILNEFRLASSISNFGSKMRLEGRDLRSTLVVGSIDGNLVNTDVTLDSYDLPLMFRVGIATDVLKADDMRLTVGVDAIHPNDHTEYLNTGVECAWNEMLFIRGGYKALFESEGEQQYTLGAGINYDLGGVMKVRIDYAYEKFGRLKDVQYLSLGVKF